ncbi:sensor histidine kinase [Agromyces ramosus]|uniref:histidine kinase n=1 Tax=Agromyces ramosus TaxID=33879 RepID=A0ABU0RCC3_9MICO|nr:sensor histidine kinase [Agromyces ramosus]MDQ0894714.1 signal transduction histidine kinase [Agromyces ramosus]
MLTVRWWDAAAIAVASVTVLITLREPPYGSGEWGTWAAAAAFLVLYAVYARRFVATGEPAAPMGHYVMIAVSFAAIVAVGAFFEPGVAILQAFVYPFLWATAPAIAAAIASNVLVAAGMAVGYALHFGDPFSGVPIATLSVVFSIALGLWITRIAEYGEERGRLLAELQAAQGQLAAMHRDAGVVDERARLAREIHDTIAQSLTGLVMVAQRAGNRLAPVDGEAADAARGDVELIEQMARDALTEARGLVASLAPISADGGLGDALRRLGSSFERETGVQVTVTSDAAALSREHEVVLLRAAQEGLANVRKHAQASHAEVTVALAPVGDEVVLSVRDDGVGPGSTVPGERGFGLAGLRDRAALVGGSFAVEPGAGGGTVLRVTVPSARPDAHDDTVDTTDRADNAAGAAGATE